MTFGKVKTKGKKYTPTRSLLQYLVRLSANNMIGCLLFWKKKTNTYVNPDIDKASQRRQLLKPFPDDKLEEWEVGAKARNQRNDYPEVIKQLKTNKQRRLF